MKNVYRGMRHQNYKLIIYQLLVRYFGNKNTTNAHGGSIEENGSGKFNDINENALIALKNFGVDYVWYTGVLEHATLTDYTAFGIKNDKGMAKGKGGSPYAIKDYYDVDPDLAVDVSERMKEFETLITRTHRLGMKVLMDFVPNHVSRTYSSDVKPSHIQDFGENDDVSKAFDPANDFYYLPDEKFVSPNGDIQFEEFPAKATGNNVFSSQPSIEDWYETIKLNYGVDVQNKLNYFDPEPPVWKKMHHILSYWAAKGVDGFRCDMAELIPLEFWRWVIGELKKNYPNLIFIAESYDKNKYCNLLRYGKFDYLYDKVGLYDAIKRLIMADKKASVNELSALGHGENKEFSHHLLRFLENHDETRIASSAFAGNAWLAVPGMVVTATLGTGPLMIYNGQEVGEPAKGSEGFSGDDGRSSIFDYWGMPQHQKWMNNGAFDGGKLDEVTKKLRIFYTRLIHIAKTNEAIVYGDFYELLAHNNVYVYLRYTLNQHILIIANFNSVSYRTKVHFPQELLYTINEKEVSFIDLLTGTKNVSPDINEGFEITMAASSAGIYEFKIL